MKKQVNVVMLPTKKATWPNCIWLGRISGQLRINTSYNNKPKSINPIDDSMLPQHLYFTSDEEIKEDDWCLNTDNNKIFKCNSVEEASQLNRFKKSFKKIVATTDTSLYIEDSEDKLCSQLLPQPSPEFIKKFIEEYNKGNVITRVMVEYDSVGHVCGAMGFNIMLGDICPACEKEKPTIKVDKNNCITITRCKDSWTRDEVISIIIKFFNDDSTGCKHDMDINDVNNWIEENLS